MLAKDTAPAGKFSFYFNAFCISSILGIWPRYIEPTLLSTTKLNMELPALKRNLKIIQISDLHFHESIKQKFLNKITARIENENPDLILITGDFLCNGILSDPDILKRFLNKLYAPFGVYAVLGNHDYNVALNVNQAGEYDAIDKAGTPALQGFSKLLKGSKVTGTMTKAALAAYPNPDLLAMLKESGVTLLNNQTVQIANTLNLTGLGELMAGAVSPEQAFQHFDPALPGIVLAHNPDSISHLKNFPGDLVLSGHTHGGQINLPWIWKRFTAMENPTFKSGLYIIEDKTLFISRGTGGAVPFRFNTMPEIVVIHLKGK